MSIFDNRNSDVSRWSSIAGLGVFLAAATAGAGWHCVKARQRCGIPGEYAYGATAARPPARSVSSAALVLRADPPANAALGRGAVKGYQLVPTSLQIDHCAISRLAVLLDRQGRCRVSLQAEQNTQATMAEQDRLARLAGVAQGGTLLQTDHIKRNEFHVVVRGYGVPAPGQSPAQALGKPLLFRVEVCPFWVQRGEVRETFADLESPDVKEYFDQINHVEIDFWYR